MSHSKKWKSEQLTDNLGNPVYDENGKAKLIKSYSLLQDRFFQYMSDSGYRGFVRGIKGSTKEHLTDLEFKIKKETEKLEKITNSVDEKQSSFNNYMQYDKQIEDISDLGKQKKFSKKIELEPQEYEDLVNYAKKGIVADKEIYERDTRIENLRNTLNRWIEKYDGLVEKTKDYFHAIKLAPQRVTDFFKSLFDKEKQDKLETELTNEEYNFLENLRNELYNKLSKMNKEELIKYLKSLCPEKNLNFEKQINDKTYKVNTYFNENSEYTILQILFGILRK